MFGQPNEPTPPDPVFAECAILWRVSTPLFGPEGPYPFAIVLVVAGLTAGCAKSHNERWGRSRLRSAQFALD